MCQAEISRKGLPALWRARHGQQARHGGSWVPTPPGASGAMVGAWVALTLHGFDLVGDVEAAQRGERTQEGGHVGGALEALGGGLHALPVVDLQVDDGPAGRARAQGRLPGCPPAALGTRWGPGGSIPRGPRETGPQSARRGGREPGLGRNGQEETPAKARPPGPATRCGSLGAKPPFSPSQQDRDLSWELTEPQGTGLGLQGPGWGCCLCWVLEEPQALSPSSRGSPESHAGLGRGRGSLTRGCPSGPAPGASARPRRPGAARPSRPRPRSA